MKNEKYSLRIRAIQRTRKTNSSDGCSARDRRYSEFIETSRLILKTKTTLLFAAVSAALFSTASHAVPDPIVAADWFPLVNGAILDYKNDAVVSSTTARVTVTSGQTFNGVSGLYSWKLSLPCDAIAGKSDWGTTAKSNGTCFGAYERFFTQAVDGVLSLGDRRTIQDYGYGAGNFPVFFRDMAYAQPLSTLVVKNGVVPGEYIRSPLPIPIGSWVLSGKSGAYWSANVSATSTYTGAALVPVTKGGIENFREVGIYSPKAVDGVQLATLHVKDAILDTSSGYALNQVRYQTFDYAKGIGPVIIKTGDLMTNAAGASNFVSNTPGGVMMETFTLTRHNLYGCPGYDPSLPPLPANSGNVCAKFYTSPVGVAKTMTEYYYAPVDYYFITSRNADKTVLDATAGWSRTGKSFTVLANNDAGTKGITRYYFDKVAKAGARGSHFYTLLNADVASLNALNVGNTQAPGKPYNEGIDSYTYLPSVTGVGGSCSGSLIPVYRLFRGQTKFPDDPNHRFTSDLSVYNDFVSKGWDGEGVNFCVPPAP